MSGRDRDSAAGYVAVELPAVAAAIASIEVDGRPAARGGLTAIEGDSATVTLRVTTRAVSGRLRVTVPVMPRRTTRVCLEQLVLPLIGGRPRVERGKVARVAPEAQAVPCE